MEQNKIVKYEGGSLIKTLENNLGITNKLLSINSKLLNILHLDDHSLFAKGIHNCIIKKYPNVNIKHIKDGTVALAHVLHSLYKNEKIDLIITDISHPGLDGLSFCRAVREKETGSVNKIPILFITMHGDKSEIQEIESIPFTKYLSKGDGCAKINIAIENLI